MKTQGFKYDMNVSLGDDHKMKLVVKNYIQIFKGNWETSKEEIREPFIVINKNPDLWGKWELLMIGILSQTGIDATSIAGPYHKDTGWLPDNWGQECYVYNSYEDDKPVSGIENAQGNQIYHNAVQISELAHHLQAGTSPPNRLAINGLSPTQFFLVFQYCIEQFGEKVDITKNDLKLAPFILRPNFDMLIKAVCDSGANDDDLVNMCLPKISGYFEKICETFGEEEVLGFYFQS